MGTLGGGGGGVGAGGGLGAASRRHFWRVDKEGRRRCVSKLKVLRRDGDGDGDGDGGVDVCGSAKIPKTHLTPKAPPPKFDKFDDTTNETSMVRCQ
jgi:hypothetical protein